MFDTFIYKNRYQQDDECDWQAYSNRYQPVLALAPHQANNANDDQTAYCVPPKVEVLTVTLI